MREREWTAFVGIIGLTLFVFGLLAWLYVILIQVTYPEWLGIRLTHYEIPPLNMRVDDVGILGFAVSALGFVVWRVSRYRLSRRRT